MRLADKILKLSEEKRMNLSEIARAAQIPFNTLRGYTRSNSKRMPNVRIGVAIAKALQVPCEWLFDDSRDWPPPPNYEQPPFPIYPWPPDGITWPEVRYAVAAYILDLHKKELGIVARVDARVPTEDMVAKVLSGLALPPEEGKE